MRKLYALLTGLLLSLTAIYSRPVTPDIANFTFLVDHPNNHVAFTNTSVLGSEPGNRVAYWTFGDGTSAVTGALQNTDHQYAGPGTYNVCLKIYRYRPVLGDSVVSAQVCKTVVIETACQANFERVTVNATSNPLFAIFRAIPGHNANKKPVRICWTFGDGRDTCIQYSTTFPGPYLVNHLYAQPGAYEVCVNILYDGGCQAHNCGPIHIERPDSCRTEVVRLPVTTANPLTALFQAQPWHNNNKKPQRICWTFGDGHDTCITYLNIFNGLYTVPHTYLHPGNYEVCASILYYGGCESRKCEHFQVGPPDSCGANFERVPTSPATSPLLAYFKALPQHNNNRKPDRICWTFGDGHDTCINYTESYTGLYGVSHLYGAPGNYQVCVNIRYFGGCEARKCEGVIIGRPDTCHADFERIPVAANTSPLLTYFRALPQHNNNRKPDRICWTFGDGRDTCITYPETYTGQYVVSHRYNQPGNYEVCVNIRYFGGCEARKCHPEIVGEPDSCSANFETPAATPNVLGRYFIAQPWHNHNKKPVRICWTFGDGRDTCIQYSTTYTGPYGVYHQYTQPGTYNVCVHILYDGGCESDKCKPVVVPAPANCEVHILEITPSITSLVRGFLAVPSSNPPARPVRVCWTFGDGSDTCIMIDPAQPVPNLTIRHTYPAPGVYRVCVRVLFQGGCQAEECKEVVIHALSDICGGYFTDSLAGPRTFVFRGHSIHAPNDDVIDYRWTFGDGVTSFGQNVTHVFTQAGDYNVCLVIRTRLGCETRICKTVRVPGNNQPALVLSPNPAANVLQVAFFSTFTETVTVRLLNSNGTPIRVISRNVTVGPNNWSMDVSNLLPGVYSLVVQSPNQLASAIFIKQ